MNTPNPLVPQGALQGMPKANSNIRIAVFTIIAIHAVFFGGLLMQGCKRDKDTTKTGTTTATNAQSNSLPPLASSNSNEYYQTLTQQLSNAEPPPSTATNINPASTNVIEPGGKMTGEKKEYSVVRNDTFSKIARKFGVSFAALKQANPGVDPAHLKAGQKLQIPVVENSGALNNAGTTGNTSTNVTEMSASNAAVHVVKPGETLSKIAKHYGVSLKSLRNANHLKTDRIAVNQKLKIPAPAHAAAHSDTSTQ